MSSIIGIFGRLPELILRDESTNRALCPAVQRPGDVALPGLIEKLQDLQKSPNDRSFHWAGQDALRVLRETDSSFINHPNTLIFDLLAALFSGQHVKHQYLAPWAIKQLVLKYELGESTDPTNDSGLLSRLANDSLFLSVLEKTYVTDLCFESFLKKLRMWLLFEYTALNRLTQEQLRLSFGLAQQCFNNEYIFTEGGDEQDRIRSLSHTVESSIASSSDEPDGVAVIVLAMYRPMTDFLTARLAEKVFRAFAFEPFVKAIRRLVEEPEIERRLMNEIPSFGEFSNRVSQEVRSHYETNPFPRWFNIGGPYPDLDSRLQSVRPDFSWPEAFRGVKKRILVAGCGTGQQPIGIAVGNPGADVVAVDLSRASLAYAKRMADRNSIQNLTFLHGDILHLSELKCAFHHVECTGVLHCMQNPVIGWNEVERVLLPGGTFHVGVYGKLARLPVEMVRRYIRESGLRSTPADMKRFRQAVITENQFDSLRKYLMKRDFFSLSMFRDLLFHDHEHCYLLSELEHIIADLDFRFLGGNLNDDLHQKFLELFPDDHHLNNFQNWKKFEVHFSATLEMFRFWLQKRAE